MPVIYPGRFELRYQDMRQENLEGREIQEKSRREQMENDEFKRRELANKKNRLLKGRARLKAMAEEDRKKVEYEIQLRHLFPPPSTETEFTTTHRQRAAPKVDGGKMRYTTPSKKGKEREAADPDTIRPAPLQSTLGDPDAILPVNSSSSTEGPTGTSGHPSPPSSTSTPPSLSAKPNLRRWRAKTEEKYQISPISSEKYQTLAISSYFLMDRFRPDIATPAPNLKRVMELGVLHLAAGGTIKGDARYHRDCCPDWPMPTRSN